MNPDFKNSDHIKIALRRLSQATGLDAASIMNEALTLYQFTAEALAKGKEPAIIDSNEETFEVIKMRGLNNIKLGAFDKPDPLSNLSTTDMQAIHELVRIFNLKPPTP